MDNSAFKLDMTMMYAAHDALRRDLVRLARTSARTDDPRRLLRAAAGWELFKTYLRVHHTSEDVALWPVMQRALTNRPDDLALLEAMETEHEAIDPLLNAIDAALIDRHHGPHRVGDLVDQLATQLSGHLRHEESEGLPLIDATLTEPQWQHFAGVHRARIGASVSSYLPWLLDGADEDRTAAVLARVPEPARKAYENEWRVSFGRLDPWRTRDEPTTS